MEYIVFQGLRDYLFGFYLHKFSFTNRDMFKLWTIHFPKRLHKNDRIFTSEDISSFTFEEGLSWEGIFVKLARSSIFSIASIAISSNGEILHLLFFLIAKQPLHLLISQYSYGHKVRSNPNLLSLMLAFRGIESKKVLANGRNTNCWMGCFFHFFCFMVAIEPYFIKIFYFWL